MIILYQSYYDELDEKRREEINYCFQKNINNPHIDKYVILCETQDLPDFLDHEKVEFIEFDHRPTYQDIFKLMIPDEVNVLANSDIFFDETILKSLSITDRQVYAITRHEYRFFRNGSIIKPFNSKPEWSQDVWIFKKPPNGEKYNEVISENLQTHRREKIPFCQGIAGCDNHLAYLLKVDYKIINPYYSIKVMHVHENESRNYKIKHRITGSTRGLFGNLYPVYPTKL